MRKLLISILSVALGAALIYGATMAWFTAEAEVDPTTFTAGTVTLGDTVLPESRVNVNPGDPYEVTWTFKYTGSKNAYLRVKPIWNYIAADGTTPLDPVILDPIDMDDTIWEKRNNDGYLYYIPRIDGVQPGQEPEEIKLTLTGKFNGAAMNNDYQGSTLTVSGIVQAIQASHQYDEDNEPGGWTWDGFDSYN
jgi:predicted ribosomally synthesized peptide with SipW-like signal peptide